MSLGLSFSLVFLLASLLALCTEGTAKVDRLPKGSQSRPPANFQGQAWVMGLVPWLGSTPLNPTACCS